MTYKQIETSREIRQWLKSIVGIAGILLYLDYRYPEIRSSIVKKFKKEGK